LIGIIGGSGAYAIPDMQVIRENSIKTTFGNPSAKLLFGQLDESNIIFLPRHGSGHKIPPHAINYRANIRALYDCGAQCIISLNAVGAISAELKAPDLCIPEQLIDYTYGRDHTFFDGSNGVVEHIDFTHPYDENVRQALLLAASKLNLRFRGNGVYAVTQGPRLESASEVNRLERDGADIVGMTGMPEAALARELGIPYASICIIVNPAAGRSQEPITMSAILEHLDNGVANALTVIRSALPILSRHQLAKH